MRYVRLVCVALAILGVLLLAGVVAAGWRAALVRATADYKSNRLVEVCVTWWGIVRTEEPCYLERKSNGGTIAIEISYKPGSTWQPYSNSATPLWKVFPAVMSVDFKSITGVGHTWAVAWWLLFLAWETPLALLYLAAWKLDRRLRIRAAQRAARHAFPIEPAPPAGANGPGPAGH